jgi:hypothetical protein
MVGMNNGIMVACSEWVGIHGGIVVGMNESARIADCDRNK